MARGEPLSGAPPPETLHRIFYGSAEDMSELGDASVDLVVTSPPYPMVEMWDLMLSRQDGCIADALDRKRGMEAFEFMHRLLDRVWSGLDRVLAPGATVCVNIGDATRKLGPDFRLYPNHTRITRTFLDMGYRMFPSVIWRKTTNKPNKFMGSGMLPPNAYVTLEHEYILIFRKGERAFGPKDPARRASAYLWEERNAWFSDIWEGLKGVRQLLKGRGRDRSAAYPLELPLRLIGMYSLQGDTVLDPFLGTGTTTLAAMIAGRNSAGYEIDGGMHSGVHATLSRAPELSALLLEERLEAHREFMEGRRARGKGAAHTNLNHGFDVITSQETGIRFPGVVELEWDGDSARARYRKHSQERLF